MEVLNADDHAVATELPYCAWQSIVGRYTLLAGLILLLMTGISLGCYGLYQIFHWDIVGRIGLNVALFAIAGAAITAKFMWPLLFCDIPGIRIWCDSQGLQWSHGSRLSKPYAWTDVTALRFGRKSLRRRSLFRRLLHAISSAVITVEMVDGARIRIAPLATGLNPHALILTATLAIYGKNSANLHVPAEDWDYLLGVVRGEDLRTMRAGCIVALVPLFLIGFAAIAYWFEGAFGPRTIRILQLAGGALLLMPLLVPLLDRMFNGPKRD